MRTPTPIPVPFVEVLPPIAVGFSEEPAAIRVAKDLGFLLNSFDVISNQVAGRAISVAYGTPTIIAVATQAGGRSSQAANGSPIIVAYASQIAAGASSMAAGGTNRAVATQVAGRALSSAYGTSTVTTTASQRVRSASQNASGTSIVTAQASQISGRASQSASGTPVIIGAAMQVAGMAHSAIEGGGSFASANQTAGKAHSVATGSPVAALSGAQIAGKATQSLSGSPVVSGAAAQRAGKATQSVLAGVISATASQVAGKAQSHASGTVYAVATAAQNAGKVHQSATGNSTVTGSAAQTAGKSTQSTVGGFITITADQAAGKARQSAAGTPIIVGSAAQTAGKAIQSASSSTDVTGTAAQVAGKATQVAIGTAGIAVTAAQTAGKALSIASGSPVAGLSGDQVAGRAFSNATGYATTPATAAQTAGKASSHASGSPEYAMSGAQVAGKATQSASGTPIITVAADQTAGRASQSMSGTIYAPASAAQIAGKATQSAAGTPTVTGSSVQYARAATQSASGKTTTIGTASQLAAGAHQSASGKTTVTGTSAKSAGKATQSASGTPIIIGAATQTAGKALSSAAGNSSATPLDPPFVVGTAPFVSGTGTISPTFAASGRIKNDLLLLAIESANQTIATPTGFTQVANSPQSTGTAAAAGGVRLAVFYKVATGTETTVSVADSGDHTTASGIVVRGTDTNIVTNLLKNSNSFTNTTYWNVYNAGSIATGTITGPDGSTLGGRLRITSPVDQADGGGIYSQSTSGLDLLAGNTTYTLSVWARGTSASQVIALAWYGNTGAPEYGSIGPDLNVTTTWQRFSYTFTTNNISFSYTNLGIYPGTALASVDVQIWGFQLELGDTMHDYVATTAGVASYLPGITITAGKVQTPATASVSFSSITTPDDNSLVVNFLANDRDSATNNNLSSVTNASLTGLTTHIDSTTSSGAGGGLAIISGVKTTAGSVSATTATNAASVTNASITVAMKPAPASTSGLWTPASLATKPLVVMDAQNISWNGSSFSQLINTGSLGGTFLNAVGSPSQSAADINGYDAISFAANSGIYLPSVATPSGNIFVFYIAKQNGSASSNFGMVVGQINNTPGWFVADEVSANGTFSNGHAYSIGDKVANGWPSGTTASAYDIMITPPTPSGYTLNAVKIGSEHLWRVNGVASTANYSNDNTRAGTTTDLTIGYSNAGNTNFFNGSLAYLAVLQDPSTDEIQRLEGWAAWKFGLADNLPISHPYRFYAPTISAFAARGGWNTTALDASVMTFSNDNRTVVGHDPTGGSHNAVRSLVGAATGKIFVSISIDAYEYMDVSLTDALDHYYVHYSYDGTIWTSAGGGATLATLSAYAAPCVIDIAADLDANLIWYRLNGGNWNGSSSNDPSTGTGGYALPRDGTKPVYAKAQILYYANGQRTINTGTVAFTYAPPSGFTALKT